MLHELFIIHCAKSDIVETAIKTVYAVGKCLADQKIIIWCSYRA